MKIKSLFTVTAVLSVVSLLFTACPEPPLPPDKPIVDTTKYDEVTLVGNCKQAGGFITFNKAYEYKTSSKVPGTKLALAGDKIIGVRVRLEGATSNVIAYAGTDRDNPERVKEVPFVHYEKGWQYILFDEPLEITGEDIYIGSHQTSNFFSIEPSEKELIDEEIYMYQDSKWFNTANMDRTFPGYFNAVQALVVGDEVVAGEAKPEFSSANLPTWGVAGDPLKVNVELTNNGIKPIMPNDLKVKISVKGSSSQVIDIPVKLTNGQSGIYTIQDFVCPDIDGTTPIRVDVFYKDGTTPINTISRAGTYIYKDRGVKRNTIMMEYFTGQSCPNCPGGVSTIKVAMSGLPEADQDKLSWVAHHTFQKDLFTIDESDALAKSLGVKTYPSCTLNRRPMATLLSSADLLWDPRTTTTALLENVLDEPGQATMEMESNFDFKTNEFKLTITGKSLEKEAYITTIITQNGIQAPQVGGPEIYIHNDAARIFLTKATGDKLELDSEGNYKVEYTCTIPEKVGDIDCVAAEMHCVAFIHGSIDNIEKRTVYNADKVNLVTGKR